jgi:hypothetical protein
MIMMDGGGTTCFICELWFDVTTALEVNAASEFEVFPNPVSSTLNMRHGETEPFTVKLFDSTGRLVLNKMLPPSETTMDIRHLKDGIYYLSFESTQGVRMRVIEVVSG